MQKTDTKPESSEAESTTQQQLLGAEKVVQETVLVEERRVINVHASGDASSAASEEAEAATQPCPADTPSGKAKEGLAVSEQAKEERGEEVEKTEREETGARSQEEEQSVAIHVSETLEQKPHFEVASS